MVPVVELRGSIPFGIAAGLSPVLTFILAVIGNLAPIPFILLFLRRVLAFLRGRSRKIDRLIERLWAKAARNQKKVERYERLGLCILVAIPLPGTGAWTGALVAVLADMRMKNALPSIILGVLIAGCIVTALSVGVTMIG